MATMQTQPMYVVRDGRATAREAADMFAATWWAEPRKIDRYNGGRFQLRHGLRWYRVEMTPAGWAIYLDGTDA